MKAENRSAAASTAVLIPMITSIPLPALSRGLREKWIRISEEVGRYTSSGMIYPATDRCTQCGYDISGSKEVPMKVLLQLTLSLLVVCPAANAANFAREPKTQPRLEQNDGIN